MTKASDNAFPSILITEGTEPSAPAAGKQRLYVDSTTHKLMLTNSSGTESEVGSGALGAWTSYTPTWTATTTNPTLGSTTIAGRYKALDSKTYVVNVTISITTGGAWNAGSGSYIFSLPAGLTAATRIQIGSAHVLDNGTAHFAGICKVSASGTTIAETVIADASGSRLLSNSIPITWATGDQINLSILLEVQ